MEALITQLAIVHSRQSQDGSTLCEPTQLLRIQEQVTMVDFLLGAEENILVEVLQEAEVALKAGDTKIDHA